MKRVVLVVFIVVMMCCQVFGRFLNSVVRLNKPSGFYSFKSAFIKSAKLSTIFDASISRNIIAVNEQESTQLLNQQQSKHLITGVEDLLEKYKGRFVCCSSSLYPNCDIYLCGTLHVTKTSADMVVDVIRSIEPQFVMVELCCERAGTLMDHSHNREEETVTLSHVLREAIQQRSLKTLGLGLLAWMQVKTAVAMGSKLGGELYAAAQEGLRVGAMVVLGDRQHDVTTQRIFDQLSMWEKLCMLSVVVWEVLTMGLFSIKDFLARSESDEAYVQGEMDKFARHMPKLAHVVITERDEYLAQSIRVLARKGFGEQLAVDLSVKDAETTTASKKGRIVAVVGAGHLQGIQRHLSSGGVSSERIRELSRSSLHNVTWPGDDTLQLFGKKNNVAAQI